MKAIEKVPSFLLVFLFLTIDGAFAAEDKRDSSVNVRRAAPKSDSSVIINEINRKKFSPSTTTSSATSDASWWRGVGWGVAVSAASAVLTYVVAKPAVTPCTLASSIALTKK